MSFEHRIPKIYYSSTDSTSPERIKMEMETIIKRFPGYDIKLSKDIFKNENDWIDHIDSVVENVDVIIFSHPNECKELYFNDRYNHEFTLAVRHKKVKCFTHLWTKYEINYDPCCSLPYKWQQTWYTHLRRN